MKKIILIGFYLFFNYTLLYSGELDERNQIINQASELFQQGDYKTLSTLAKTFRKTEEKTSSGRYKLRFVYYGIFESIDIVVKKKYNNSWDKFEKVLSQWTKSQPSDPISHITYVIFLTKKAWMYRGNNYAKNTPEENWLFFHTEVDKAIKYLIKHKDIASQDPHWYTTMLNLAKLDSWNRLLFYTIINEAINRYPHYYSIYSLTLYYLDPKWNGFTQVEIEEIAQLIFNVTKDKDGAYARYYLMVKDILGKYISTSNLDINWKIMQNSMEKLVEKYPSEHNINNLAYFSCLANQGKIMKKYVNKILGKPILDIWKNQINFDTCKNFSQNNQEVNITTISPDKAIDYINNYRSEKPLVIYFSSYKKNDILKDFNKIEKLAKEYNNKVEFLSVNFYPNKLFSYPNLIKRFHLKDLKLPLSITLYKKKVILSINESAIPKMSMKLLKDGIDELLKKKPLHSSQKKILKDNLVKETSHNNILVESLIKEIPTDEIEEYIDKNSNNSKPLIVYFDYEKTKYKPSPGLKHIAKKYKNEFNIVTVYFDFMKKDAIHLSIKKRFDKRSNPSTIIIHKNKIVYKKGDNLNNTYSRNTLDKDLTKYIREQSVDFYK